MLSVYIYKIVFVFLYNNMYRRDISNYGSCSVTVQLFYRMLQVYEDQLH